MDDLEQIAVVKAVFAHPGIDLVGGVRNGDVEPQAIGLEKARLQMAFFLFGEQRVAGR